MQADFVQVMAHAARLLRVGAEELRDGISLHGVPDWENEPDTAKSYQEHIGVAEQLEVAVSAAEPLLFPVSLRKMWSGAEVQGWIDGKGLLFGSCVSVQDIAKNGTIRP